MTQTPYTSTNSSQAHALVGVARFLRLVMFRKGILAICLILCGGLGALYYSTAEKRYQSEGKLYIAQPEATSQSVHGVSVTQRDQMPTYLELVVSEKVLRDAIRRLPKKDRGDFITFPQSKWIEKLASKLTVKNPRQTSIISVSYQSSNPHTAVAVVNAVLSSYIDYMESTQQKTGKDVLQILLKEKEGVEFKLQVVENQLTAARNESGILQAADPRQSLNIVQQRAQALNEELAIRNKQRIEAHSKMLAIERAVENGEDLAQFAIAMSDGVGGGKFSRSDLGSILPMLTPLPGFRMKFTRRKQKLRRHSNRGMANSIRPSKPFRERLRNRGNSW